MDKSKSISLVYVTIWVVTWFFLFFKILEKKRYIHKYPTKVCKLMLLKVRYHKILKLLSIRNMSFLCLLSPNVIDVVDCFTDCVLYFFYFIHWEIVWSLDIVSVLSWGVFFDSDLHYISWLVGSFHSILILSMQVGEMASTAEYENGSHSFGFTGCVW